jgi:uncharacterized protein YkwD
MLDSPLRRRLCATLAGALLGAAGPVCLGDTGLTGALNKLRAQRCGTPEPLRDSARLAQVAQLLSRGTRLQDAQRQAGYHSLQLLSLQLSGPDDENSLVQMLGRGLCSRLAAPGMRELGIYRQGGDTWIVLGEPFIAPDPRDQEAIIARVLYLTNQARGKARLCGGSQFPAAPALTLDARLTQAAREHSRDMAAHGYMDHRAPDGSLPGERVSRTGYRWLAVGENLASGMSTADAVVKGWLGSPHHCANLMGAQFRQMGAAFAVNLDAKGAVYWTQVFGTPRS